MPPSSSEAYDAKAAESDRYYQELVQAKANADIGFNGLFGGSALYFPDIGEFGAGITLGVGFGKFMLTVGADYKIPKPFVFDISKLTYRAGLAVRFQCFLFMFFGSGTVSPQSHFFYRDPQEYFFFEGNVRYIYK